MALRIIGVKIKDYKGIKAMELVLNPDDKLVYLTGRNGAGKTSVLDAIYAAVRGGDAARETSQPIRDGQDTAVIELDMGDIIVTRRWTKDDAGTLSVTSKDGAKYPSQQKLLDGFLDKRAFDPLAFINQKESDQVKTLLAVLGDTLTFDPADLDRRSAGVYEARTEVGRVVTRLEGQFAGFPPVDDTLPQEEVTSTSILAELKAAQDSNVIVDRLSDTAAAAQSERERAEANLARLTDELDAAQTFLLRAKESEASLLAEYKLTERIDTDAFSARLDSVEATNAKVREQLHRAAVGAELADARTQRAQHTIALEAIESERQSGLAAAVFPIEGLSFDKSGVTFNGIPFSQCSTAEQFYVSAAVSMSLHSELRLMRIDRGESLDSTSVGILQKLANDRDYQVWITKVDESGAPVGDVSFVIEDGQVAVKSA